MKTAVEWLVEEINKLTGLTIQMDEPIIEQAKEMEKQQMNHFVELSKWLIENKRSVFESADISNKRKKKILNELGYSSLDY